MVEGEEHVCNEVAASSSEGVVSNGKSWGNSAADSLKKVDYQVIYALLKNPQRAASLQPDKDLVYGILGLVASILGFMIWVWMVGKKLSSLLNDLFGFNDINSFFETGSVSNKISTMLTGKLFGLSIVSIVALGTALWLIGIWLGRKKLTLSDFITYFGGMQYSFGAGFIIAGLGTIVGLRISIILVIINLLASLVLNLMLASEISEVSKDRRLTFVASSIAAYIIVSAVLAVIII